MFVYTVYTPIYRHKQRINQPFKKNQMSTSSKSQEITSKTVSMRIPMPEYMKLLQEAYEHRISISELLMLRIFNKDKDSAKVTEYKLLFRGTKAQLHEFLANDRALSAVFVDLLKGRTKKSVTSKIMEIREGEVIQRGRYEVRMPKKYGRTEVWEQME